jgi:hypothetical protein
VCVDQQAQEALAAVQGDPAPLAELPAHCDRDRIRTVRLSCVKDGHRKGRWHGFWCRIPIQVYGINPKEEAVTTLLDAVVTRMALREIKN